MLKELLLLTVELREKITESDGVFEGVFGRDNEEDIQRENVRVDEGVRDNDRLQLGDAVSVRVTEDDLLKDLLQLNDDVFVVVFEDERIAVAEKDGRGVKLAL